jgi:hypothetical protein
MSGTIAADVGFRITRTGEFLRNFRKSSFQGMNWLGASVFQRFDPDSRAVAENFRHALHQLIRVITNSDHGIGTCHIRLDQHGIKSLLPRPLGELGEERDITAEQRLQTGADRADYRT